MTSGKRREGVAVLCSVSRRSKCRIRFQIAPEVDRYSHWGSPFDLVNLKFQSASFLALFQVTFHPLRLFLAQSEQCCSVIRDLTMCLGLIAVPSSNKICLVYGRLENSRESQRRRLRLWDINIRQLNSRVFSFRLGKSGH